MNKKPVRSPWVSDALIDSLEAVLTRYWSAEFHDYHAAGRGNLERPGHIFLHLEVLRAWLDYVEEDCGRGGGSPDQ